MSSDRIERAGWLIGAVLLAATVFFRSAAVSIGVAVGVLIAVLNYRLLVRFVRATLAADRPALSRPRLVLYLLKYAFTAAVIVVALHFNLANAIAILVGASVLLPAIAWETIATQRTLLKEEA